MEESIFNFVWIYLDMFEKLMRKKCGFKCCRDILEFCTYVISMDNKYLECNIKLIYIMYILRIIDTKIDLIEKRRLYFHKAIIRLNIKYNRFTFDL